MQMTSKANTNMELMILGWTANEQTLTVSVYVDENKMETVSASGFAAPAVIGCRRCVSVRGSVLMLRMPEKKNGTEYDVKTFYCSNTS